jgi:hypothetical protein
LDIFENKAEPIKYEQLDHILSTMTGVDPINLRGKTNREDKEKKDKR